MKWKEMSAFYKAVAVIFWLSAVASIIGLILGFTNILFDADLVLDILSVVLWLSYGILTWKTNRGFAITMIVLSVIGLLTELVFLFL